MTTTPDRPGEQPQYFVPASAATPPRAPRPTRPASRPATKRKGKRRHAAAGSRRVAGVLASTSAFGLVALLGVQGHATQVQAAAGEPLAAPPATATVPTTAPAPVVVIRRTYVQADGTTSAAPPATAAPTTAPTYSPPPVTAAPRRAAPVTQSSSS